MDDKNQRTLSVSSDSYESSSSSENEELSSYIFYCNRPEWSDVQPILQDDGPTPVVRVAYSRKFSDVYDYLRGVLATGEKSERTLELVTTALKLNPANQTVWNYRLDIVLYLKVDLHVELQYVSNMIRKFIKNYQVWHYRKNIVKILNDPSAELEFTAEILDMDPKSYHAWQYRQWVLRKFSHLIEKEMEFVDKLISQDIMNNSAWNQRHFVINNLAYDSNKIVKELQYTFDKIVILSKNESSWNYLKGLLLFKDNKILENKVRDFCTKLYNDGNRSVHLIACLIDMLDADIKSTEPKNIAKVKFALKLCSDLANVYDPIRCSYWTYICSDIEKTYNIKGDDNKIDNNDI
ncbi:Protein prenyltransferase, alpha subunit [Cinara cedri]|uniref:Protein farnesyltransferase/geranylgeranyltransferase type-1 subunit alpha n=1 Tax=Cinara cedri TaxID=506608 RepID=A0A5E4NGR0_9HEMI|nr:Protein prenyltransferase, alpha subunit [Cinara cedri]